MVQRTPSSLAGTMVALALFGATLAGAAAQPAKEKAEPCIACHGENGNSQIENVPSLAGQPAKYLLIQLILFRDNQHLVEAMTPFADNLTHQDVQEPAAHFADPKPV